MVLLSTSIVSKDSNPVAERVSSTIRELLWRATRCWGTISLTQSVRKQIWSQSELNGSRKADEESYPFSDVLRCSQPRKMITVTMPVDVSKWVSWSLNATIKQTCDSGVTRTPYSCSGVSSRRIRARLARRTQQFDFDSTTATSEDTTSIRRQSSGPTAARCNNGPNLPRRWSMMSSMDFPPVVIILPVIIVKISSRF